MKKFLLPSILLFGASAFAQDASSPYLMNLQLKNGDKVQYEISNIESITFENPTPAVKPVSVAVPTDFSKSWVQKVMFNGKQIAEIDKEYIKATGKQHVVIYPCGEDGRADLTKGVTTTGASVVWDLTANTATVGEEGTALTTVYVSDGAILTSFDGESDAATVEPDIIKDNRGLFERNTYRIVKIGTQYWMADNLRTTYFRDGSSIVGIAETDASAWNANTTGAYLTESEADWVKVAGYLYNGYCVTSEKGIAPEGWEVPTRDQLVKLRSAGKLLAANFKAEEFGTWSAGTTGNNITGFDAVATGYYSTATNLNELYSEAYFWSATTFYDFISKSNGLETFRISNKANNVAVSSNAGHDLKFGHSIRCIRK